MYKRQGSDDTVLDDPVASGGDSSLYGAGADADGEDDDEDDEDADEEDVEDGE